MGCLLTLFRLKCGIQLFLRRRQPPSGLRPKQRRKGPAGVAHAKHGQISSVQPLDALAPGFPPETFRWEAGSQRPQQPAPVLKVLVESGSATTTVTVRETAKGKRRRERKSYGAQWEGVLWAGGVFLLSVLQE